MRSSDWSSDVCSSDLDVDVCRIDHRAGALGHLGALGQHGIEAEAVEARAHDLEAADVLDARHLDGQPLARPAEAHELRADAELDAAVARPVAAAERDLAAADAGAVPGDLSGQHLQSRRADTVHP